jgi:hypothetical protein
VAQERLDQQARLRGAAAAELGERERRGTARGDLVGVVREDLVLGAREVVLGQLADLLEEL